jgi:Phosphodiester glycosidase
MSHSSKFFRYGLLLMVFCVLLFTNSVNAEAPQDILLWDAIVPGIDYIKIELPDPNNVFVARMDRSNSTLTIESTIAQGKLSEGKETVSGMYSRYDQALNYWGGSINPPTWGMRNQTVVAINGSYFDWATGLPQGGQIQSGWYAKRFDDLGGWSGFAWKLDRSAFIGECVFHRPDKQFAAYPATGGTQQISNINSPRGANQLVLYTPQYNSNTGTDNSGVEVVVEMTRPSMILPSPAYASGTVRHVFDGVGNSLIPFNSIVLSASGTAAQTLLANVHIGDEIHISQEITSYDYDCATPNSISWTKTYASIQGAFFFLDNSVIRDFDDPGATERNPRTAIAFNGQYIYFIVVDGRDSHLSYGMTIHELAVFTRDVLGATWGVAQDGGGSSTMVINGLVVNNTYCNIYSCVGEPVAYLPIVAVSKTTGNSTPAKENDIVTSAAGVERAVANGMLMVVARPPEFSTIFHPGDSITSLGDTLMRLGPGTNYSGFITVPSGSHVTIQNQENGINGVLAKGVYWWYINFNGQNGWVNESFLTGQ